MHRLLLGIEHGNDKTYGELTPFKNEKIWWWVKQIII
jgi:hypothetical protein